jgi:hypothetical protein
VSPSVLKVNGKMLPPMNVMNVTNIVLTVTADKKIAVSDVKEKDT